MSTLPVLQSFQDEFNQLIGRPFFDIGRFTSNKFEMWRPEIDIEEHEKDYQVKANLPGVEQKDIEVYFNNGLLTIKGKLESKKEEKHKKYIQCERSYGEFSRSFSLPNTGDDAKIEADFKNGVLSVSIPKTKANIMKRIEVKS